MIASLSPTMMQTFTGRVIDLTNFQPQDVCIDDIAHALSILNRFTGHSKAPYSVAQHCVMVSQITKPENARWGLMHDASEAYLGDVARPLKILLPSYKQLETHVQQVIAQVFGLEWPMPSDVHAADNRALMAEKRDLISVDVDWGINFAGDPKCGPINPYCWHQAKRLFEDRYKELFQ